MLNEKGQMQFRNTLFRNNHFAEPLCFDIVYAMIKPIHAWSIQFEQVFDMDVFCQGIIAPLLLQYRNDCHRKASEHSHHQLQK